MVCTSGTVPISINDIRDKARALKAIKEILEIREGIIGPKDIYGYYPDSFVTFRCLIDAILNYYLIGQAIKEWAIDTDILFNSVRKTQIYHAYGGFQDESEAVSISAVDTWTWITNATNDLWTGIESDGVSLSGDIMTIENAGDYAGALSMSFSGSNGKDFQVRIYNITQSTQMGYVMGATTFGAGNFSNVSLPLYIEAEAGDTFRMEVQCITDASDPTFKNAVFHLSYLHD